MFLPQILQICGNPRRLLQADAARPSVLNRRGPLFPGEDGQGSLIQRFYIVMIASDLNAVSVTPLSSAAADHFPTR